jgi:phosphate transport system protein
MTSAALSGGDIETIREDFFTRDNAINQHEQSIRRKVLVHLSVQSNTDVPACLVLMTVARDAERIGDYTKNMFEVLKRTPELGAGPFYDQILQLCAEISEAFTNVGDVFKKSDATSARVIREANYRLEKQCDAAINELLRENADYGTPVAYALLFRFSKRILRHLSNIVSSVVMPVDKIDYFDKTSETPDKAPAQTTR